MKKLSLMVAFIFILGMFSLTQSFAAVQQTEPSQPGHSQMQGAFRAEDLEGKTVKGHQGEDLGKIEDVMIGPQGDAAYAVIEGDQDRMYPVPIKYLQKGVEQDEFRINITKDQLRQAPSFRKDEHANLSDREWQQRIYGYYESQGQQKPQSQMQQNRQTQQQERQPQAQSQQLQREGMGQQAAQVRVNEDLVGKNVVNSQGEELGEVEDVVADAQGNIRYIILSHGGFLGIGDELIPIPWKVVEQGQTEQRDAVLVNLNKEKLQNAPRFKASDRPDFMEREYNERVYGYYGVRPD